MGKLFSKSYNTKKQDEGRFHSDSSKDWASADDISVTSTSADDIDKFSQQIVFDDFADIEEMSELTDSSDSADMNDLVDMNDSADINDLANTFDFSDIGDFTALSEQFMEFTKFLNDGTAEGQNSESDLSIETDIHSFLLEQLEQVENYQNNEPESPPRFCAEGLSQPSSSTLPLLLHRVASLFNAGQRREQEDSKHPLRDDSPMSHLSKLTSSNEEDDSMKYQGPIPVRLPAHSPLDIMWKNDLYVPHPSFEDMTLLLYPMRLIESNPPTPRPRTIIERSKSCFF